MQAPGLPRRFDGVCIDCVTFGNRKNLTSTNLDSNSQLNCVTLSKLLQPSRRKPVSFLTVKWGSSHLPYRLDRVIRKMHL